MLKINSLDLSNYRGFEKLHLDFSSQVTCIAGINGSGKTSILNALALSFSWIIARAKNQNGKGWTINKQFDIHSEPTKNPKLFSDFEDIPQNFAKEGFIQANFTFLDKPLIIKHAYSALGTKTDKSSEYYNLSDIFDYVSSKLQNNQLDLELPVLVYYPTNRSVLDIPVRIRMQHSFNQFSTYENALDATARFRDFFEWYRDREDIENAKKSELRDFNYEDPLLSAVRTAIYKCLPGYSNLHIQRTPQLMLITKNQTVLSVNSLSDGEKCLFSLVGDLARRLALAAPKAKNPLMGSGIILIDEIDLHLHPAWQRKVVEMLKKTFPNCQFIITTHSPQVIGELPASDIFILNNNTVFKPNQTFGLTSNDILNCIMDYDNNKISMIRNNKIEKLINDLALAVDKEDFINAKKLIKKIEEQTNGPIYETRMYQAEIDMLSQE